MSDSPLRMLRDVFQGLFPWLAGVRATGDKALSFRTTGGPLHLQGDAGDPAALTTADTGGQLASNTLDGMTYYLPPGGAAYVPVATYAAAPGPPPPTFAGTAVKLGPGSKKVTVAP